MSSSFFLLETRSVQSTVGPNGKLDGNRVDDEKTLLTRSASYIRPIQNLITRAFSSPIAMSIFYVKKDWEFGIRMYISHIIGL